MMKFPLPSTKRRSDAKAHPFPIQIAIQTQEFLQATIFHAAFLDIATGEVVRQDNGFERVHQIMRAGGLDDGVVDQAWDFIQKYQPIFETAVFQSALIALNSQWDWYVRRLTEFIQFATSRVGRPSLSPQDQKRLKRASRLPLLEQIELVELTTGVKLMIDASDKEELFEMSLVRNLGLHNRWEMDADYVQRTRRSGAKEGDLRIVDVAELRKWHSIMLKLVQESSLECSKRFHDAPDF